MTKIVPPLLLWLILSTAEAVSLSENGTGQVLVFPYYTVDEGFQSLLSVTNTTDLAKAVNVRFREGSNNRSVLEFHLYLGPRDTWTAALFSLDGEGPANLLTRDDSCTVPKIASGEGIAPSLPTLPSGERYVPFRRTNYTFGHDDAGPDDLSRSRQGMVELIEMGVLTDEAFGSATATTSNGGCEQLNRAWNTDSLGQPMPDSYWVMNPISDLLPPGGGLTGSMRLVAALDGIQISYKPETIDNFAMSILHSAPTFGEPNLSSANYDPDGDGMINSVVPDPSSDGMIQSSWAEPIDAVSAVFMSRYVDNEIVLDEELAAITEWVLTFPTKQFYTDGAIVGEAARSPFEVVYQEGGAPSNFPQFGACHESGLERSDRDGRLSSDEDRDPCPGCCFNLPCPFLFPRIPLCHSTNVVGFDNQGAGRLFGNSIPRFDQDWAGFDGHLRVKFLERQLVDEQGRIYFGLPVIGFSAEVLKNGNSFGNGVLANYAAQSRHVSIPLIERPAVEKTSLKD